MTTEQKVIRDYISTTPAPYGVMCWRVVLSATPLMLLRVQGRTILLR